MSHAHHHQDHAQRHGHPIDSTGPREGLNSVAFRATLHCLSGCAVGEVLGMVLGTAWGLSNGATIALAIALAFAFGYAFTFFPLLRSGLPLRSAIGIAFAADTASITLMEIVDNAIMLVIPGAMEAGLDQPLFWVALAVSLLTAGAAAIPLNRLLIQHGKGHALAHAGHGGHWCTATSSHISAAESDILIIKSESMSQRPWSPAEPCFSSRTIRQG